MRHFLLTACFAFLAAFLCRPTFCAAQETLPSGASSAPVIKKASEKPAPGRGSYVLGSGDQILIRAANMPDISEKPMRIDLNGYINMPMIGRIDAGGMTV